jgi:hypothetical protein
MSLLVALLVACSAAGGFSGSGAAEVPPTPEVAAAPSEGRWDDYAAACTPSAARHFYRYKLPERARFEAWVDPHRAEYEAFERLLADEGVADVFPAWTLWYQGTDWQKVELEPFAVPPRDLWRHMVPTLRFVRDGVVPVTGALCVASAFRTPEFNARADGTKGSKHLDHYALDLIPRRAWDRSELHVALGTLHDAQGAEVPFALGLYIGLRFHNDTHRKRRG